MQQRNIWFHWAFENCSQAKTVGSTRVHVQFIEKRINLRPANLSIVLTNHIYINISLMGRCLFLIQTIIILFHMSQTQSNKQANNSVFYALNSRIEQNRAELYKYPWNTGAIFSIGQINVNICYWFVLAIFCVAGLFFWFLYWPKKQGKCDIYTW